MFALAVFEILLFEGKSVLCPAQRVAGSERVKKKVYNNKEIMFIYIVYEYVVVFFNF